MLLLCVFFFFQAEDGIRYLVRSRGLGDVYKRQEKILIGGSFSQIDDSTANNIGRLNSDGRIDTSFHSGTGTGSVEKILVQSGGKILIGGWGTHYNGSFIGRLARLESNGVLDSTFHNEYGTNGTIYTLCLQDDNKILVGGNFMSFLL